MGGREREREMGEREGGREGNRNQIIYFNCWCGHIKWD